MTNDVLYAYHIPQLKSSQINIKMQSLIKWSFGKPMMSLTNCFYAYVSKNTALREAVKCTVYLR